MITGALLTGPMIAALDEHPMYSQDELGIEAEVLFRIESPGEAYLVTEGGKSLSGERLLFGCGIFETRSDGTLRWEWGCWPLRFFEGRGMSAYPSDGRTVDAVRRDYRKTDSERVSGCIGVIRWS